MKTPKIKFTYKLAFRIVTVALSLFIFAFVGVPLACGYTIGFLNGYQWQASNVIGLLGVVGTLSAVSAAIFIPTRIAKQQNKIALFKERLETYYVLLQVFTLIYTLENSSVSPNYTQIKILLDNSVTNAEQSSRESQVTNFINTYNKIEFLFDVTEDEGEYLGVLKDFFAILSHTNSASQYQTQLKKPMDIQHQATLTKLKNLDSQREHFTKSMKAQLQLK